MEAFAEQFHLLLLTAIVFLLPPLAQALVPPYEHADGRLLRTNGSGRILLFDALKGIAILAVIVIHVTDLWPSSAASIHPFLDMLDASMRFALPFFFMLSGILLTPPGSGAQQLLSFYRDRLVTIFVPYALVVVVLGYLYRLSPLEVWHGFYTGSLSVPFYFLVILAQLYLLYPLLARVARKRWFVYASLLFSVGAQLLPYWYVFEIPLAFRFVGFFVWGVYMSEYVRRGQTSQRILPYGALVVLFFAGYALFPGAYYNMRPYYGIGLFMVLYLLYLKGYLAPVIEQWLAYTGAMSLWIFLLHYPIMAYLIPAIAPLLPQSAAPALVILVLFSVVISLASGFLGAYLYQQLTHGVKRLLDRQHA